MNQHLLPADDTKWVLQRATAAGFDLCGIAVALKFPELQYYSDWIARGFAGEMKYLSDERRLDPRRPLPGARSLIVCALNYNSKLPYSAELRPDSREGETPHGWISRYAWGDDYHEVLWDKLNVLAAEMREHFPEPCEMRAYADTGPIHERAAAKYAGLGWLGKHTLLINQLAGSWLFLGVIVTTLPLAPTLGAAEAPPSDRCGTCTRCIEACPTQAIVEPYVLDASRCISYLTIEKRGMIPEEFREAMGTHVFGCDICQDVCPWNRRSPRTASLEFQPRKLGQSEADRWSLFQPDLLRLANLTETEFRESFRGSPIKRTKWRGLVRNVCIALGNVPVDTAGPMYPKILSTLNKLSVAEDPAIAESALWALARIQQTKLGRDSPGSPR